MKKQKIINFILGLLYPLRLHRLRDLPGLWIAVIRYYLVPADPLKSFPPVETAMKHPDGLLAIGGSFSTQRLLDAYRNGIFPFSHLPPIKWWAPENRMVLIPEEIHIEKNVRRLLRRKIYSVTFDKAFRDVILACQEPREKKKPLTWINDKNITAFCQLFENGNAHSVEVWDDQKHLIGGIFGISIGAVFFNESQFSRIRDTSKLAMAYLNCHLYNWGYQIHDCMKFSSHLERLGAHLIPRAQFSMLLNKWCDKQCVQGLWKIDQNLDVAQCLTEMMNKHKCNTT
ncbi:MAG: leucyl/phenylalanyl-tRNA--protein transferase [Thiohalomonadales bacterium]